MRILQFEKFVDERAKKYEFLFLTFSGHDVFHAEKFREKHQEDIKRIIFNGKIEKQGTIKIKITLFSFRTIQFQS